MRWGENVAQMTRRLGRPSSQGDAGPMGASVSYPARDVLDEPTEPYFMVHPRWGMIQGNYLVRVVDFEARHVDQPPGAGIAIAYLETQEAFGEDPARPCRTAHHVREREQIVSRCPIPVQHDDERTIAASVAVRPPGHSYF